MVPVLEAAVALTVFVRSSVTVAVAIAATDQERDSDKFVKNGPGEIKEREIRPPWEWTVSGENIESYRVPLCCWEGSHRLAFGPAAEVDTACSQHSQQREVRYYSLYTAVSTRRPCGQLRRQS